MLRTLNSTALTAVFFATLLALSGALVACGDDDGGGTTDSGTASDSGAGTDSGSGNASPVISRIAWEPEAGCTTGTASDFTITVTATDADNMESELTYSGTVIGCSGNITGASSILVCPNAAPYTGNVTVTDPDSNSDTASFTFGACDSGSADF